MIVLGIETSTSRSSVALLVDDDVVAHEHHHDARGHGAFLAPAMRRCLDAAAALGGIGALDAVAVGTGPGLYTGLRVGMATGGAFAAARGLPIVGIGGMDTLAHGSGVRDGTIVTTLDARRGQVFWAVHAVRDGVLVRVDGPLVGMRSELDALLAELALDADVAVVGEIAVDTVRHPDAADTARLARAVLARTPVEELVPAALVATYLRDADVRIGWAERGGVRGGAPAGDGAS
jgi:tRNA threonylcarbamoyladenosine biosynthesis protein TsaB